LLFTIGAAKEISERYGCLEALSEALMKPESPEAAFILVVELLVLLANQVVMLDNLSARHAPCKLLAAEDVMPLISPMELRGYVDGIMRAVCDGAARNVLSDNSAAKGQARQAADAETYTWLYYFGTGPMGVSPDEFWLMPIGLFLDLRACYLQSIGAEKPLVQQSIDDIIPEWI